MFYAVEDDEHLPSIMTQYYVFFAAGQRVCTSSYVKYQPLGVTMPSGLYSSVMPVYDRSTTERKLLGVSAIDSGVIADSEDLQTMKDWDLMICRMSDMTK